MPKRWRVVRGGSWTWEYYDTQTGEVFDRSGRTWERRRKAREAVQEMKDADVDEDTEEDED
jgi:hypothetical protein